jgi:hypothetical protein
MRSVPSHRRTVVVARAAQRFRAGPRLDRSLWLAMTADFVNTHHPNR